MLKKIAARLIPLNIRKQLRNFHILSNQYGQYRTIQKGIAVDKEGNHLPWYTYPTIEYLCNIDFTTKRIFEYGSGASSIFWAERAQEVVSVENDPSWYAVLKQQIRPNQKILLCDKQNDYIASITKQASRFDVVIIDGKCRMECARITPAFLAVESNEGAMVILDNSDWYKETARFLRNNLNLIEVDFHGFGPVNDYTWTTSIFLSRNFAFKPKTSEQPCYSMAALQINSCELKDGFTR